MLKNTRFLPRVLPLLLCVPLCAVLVGGCGGKRARLARRLGAVGTAAAAATVFDVPSLVGADYNKLVNTLGEPSNQRGTLPGHNPVAGQSVAVWNRPEVNLNAVYSPASGAVEFLALTPGASSAPDQFNAEEAVKQCNLQSGVSGHQIQALRNRNTNQVVCIMVKPAT